MFMLYPDKDDIICTSIIKDLSDKYSTPYLAVDINGRPYLSFDMCLKDYMDYSAHQVSDIIVGS